MIILNVKATIMGFLLTLDGWVYGLINNLYKAFLYLANFKIFEEADITAFLGRVYVIIGIVMLFLLAYDLLKNIVNPDAKGKDSAGKTIFNVVRAIILLAIVPSLFDLAYDFQNAILSYNTIGKIIVGGDGIKTPTKNMTSSDIIDQGGITMALGVIQSFIVPTDGYDSSTAEFESGKSLDDLWDIVIKNGDFSSLDRISDAVAEDSNSRKIDYHYILCGLAGLFVGYLLLSYCISLGLRIIKMAAYELMAPIPIIASIIPGKQDMLNKWTKVTLSTYIEVFIRVAVLYLGVYILTLIGTKMDSDVLFTDITGFTRFFIKTVLFIGVITFVKSAPDLISEILPISKGSMTANLKDQLKTGGFFAAASTAGAAALGLGAGVVRAGSSLSTVRKKRKKFAETHGGTDLKTAQNDYKTAKKNWKRAKRMGADEATLALATSDMKTAKDKIKGYGYGSATVDTLKKTSAIIPTVLSSAYHANRKDVNGFKDVLTGAATGVEAAKKSAALTDTAGGFGKRIVKGVKTGAFNLGDTLGVGNTAYLDNVNKNIGSVIKSIEDFQSAIKSFVTDGIAKGTKADDFIKLGVTRDQYDQLVQLQDKLKTAPPSRSDYATETDYNSAMTQYQTDMASYRKKESDLSKIVNATVQNAILHGQVDSDELKSLAKDLSSAWSAKNKLSIELKTNSEVIDISTDPMHLDADKLKNENNRLHTEQIKNNEEIDLHSRKKEDAEKK